MFEHLVAMTDRFGTFEHADHAVARREHGYCVDDVARVLIVAARSTEPTDEIERLIDGSIEFIRRSQGPTGDIRNRRASDGCWTSRRALDDSWGRSLWGLGTAVANAPSRYRSNALELFERGALRRSASRRTMSFAAFGAASVLEADPNNSAAVDLLHGCNQVLGNLGATGEWTWPEARLWYANAALPEAMIVIGTALGRVEVVDRGLELLDWLLRRETRDGHLSVTPVGGAGPGDLGPGFDQQPIEVASMADACARAQLVDRSRSWTDGIEMANSWFDGSNDVGVIMWDRETGGAYDGLSAGGANLNQGTESTVALISTRQCATISDRISA